MNKKQIVVKAYTDYRGALVNYVMRYIGCADEAEDVVQDAFVRLMEVGDTICESTVKSFLFTVAKNTLIDRLRRKRRLQNMYSYIYDTQEDMVSHVEEDANAADIAEMELKCIAALPKQRRRIYCMSRFDGCAANEIAKNLGISQRTVETHLFLGRKEVRSYLRCVGI